MPPYNDGMTELMNRRVAFVDTETDGLDVARAMPWEIAILTGGREHLIYVDIDTTHSDPDSLRFSRFDERHPSKTGVGEALSVADAAELVADLLAGVTLVAANPAFDAAVLTNLCGPATWDYHLLDVEAAALGWLRAHGHELPSRWSSHTTETCHHYF